MGALPNENWWVIYVTPYICRSLFTCFYLYFTLFTFRQLQGIIFVVLMSSIAGPPSDQDVQVTSTCGTGVAVQGWQGDKLQKLFNFIVMLKILITFIVPNLVFCGITCALAMTFVLFFWPKYKRMAAEMKTKKQSQQLIQSANNSPRDSQNEQIGGSTVTVVTIT